MSSNIEKRHATDQPPDAPDDYYVRSRSVDSSWWIKTAFLFEKYRILVWLAGVILIAFGFGFQTPASKLDAIQAQVSSTRRDLQAEVDTIKSGRLEQQQMLEFSTRYICATLSTADRYRLGGTDLCATAAHSTIR
jgi:hypothetical protein